MSARGEQMQILESYLCCCFICRSKQSNRMNSLLHISHLTGRSAWCVRICSWTACFDENVLLQISHMNVAETYQNKQHWKIRIAGRLRIAYFSLWSSLLREFSRAFSASAPMEKRVCTHCKRDPWCDVLIWCVAPNGIFDWTTCRTDRSWNHFHPCDWTCAIAIVWPGWSSSGIFRKRAAGRQCGFCCGDWVFLLPKSICGTVNESKTCVDRLYILILLIRWNRFIPIGTHTAFRRYACDDAFATHHLKGMIFRTNRKGRASHQCACECGCCKWIRFIVDFFFCSTTKLARWIKWNLTSTATTRRTISRNADTDSPSSSSTVQYGRADVRANYRYAWTLYRTHGTESLLSAATYRSLCTLNADPNGICVWSLCRNFDTRTVCRCHVIPCAYPVCLDPDRWHYNWHTDSLYSPSAMCTNDVPGWCAIWRISDRNRIWCDRTDNESIEN